MARARSFQSIKQVTLPIYNDRSELFLVVGTYWIFGSYVQVGAHGPLVIFSYTSEEWLESRECFLLCYLQRARVMQRPKFQQSCDCFLHRYHSRKKDS